MSARRVILGSDDDECEEEGGVRSNWRWLDIAGRPDVLLNLVPVRKGEAGLADDLRHRRSTGSSGEGQTRTRTPGYDRLYNPALATANRKVNANERRLTTVSSPCLQHGRYEIPGCDFL